MSDTQQSLQETTKDELMEIMAYHQTLRGLLIAMSKPGRGRTIGNIGDNEEPQIIFGVNKVDGCPVTSITLPAELLHSLANSVNLRLLIEDEILKCEEHAEKAGLDIHEPDIRFGMTGYTDTQRAEMKRLAEAYHDYWATHALTTSTPSNRANALRLRGDYLLELQSAAGVELIVPEMIDAAVLVASAEVES